MSRRMSIGYFMHPDYDAQIECLPSCVDDGILYPPITAGDHIRKKIEASHAK
jgi:isopenicillin N synthase-like dioxygenase